MPTANPKIGTRHPREVLSLKSGTAHTAKLHVSGLMGSAIQCECRAVDHGLCRGQVCVVRGVASLVLLAEEIQDEGADLLELLPLRDMTGPVDDLNPGVRDPVSELLCVDRRDQCVLLAPEDQR